MEKSKLLVLSALAFAMSAGLAACDISSSPESSVPPTTSSEVPSVSSCTHAGIQHVDAKEPTCDEGGNLEYYYCADCETYYDAQMQEADYSDLLLDAAHKLVKHDAVPGREQSSAEYYECSECHKYFNDDEASLEYQEGEWITNGTAIHWAKGEQMMTKSVNMITLTDLEGKAMAFDFKFTEEGTNFICFGQTTAYTWNVTQSFTLTYAGGVYSTDRGIVEQPGEGDDGWATCIINRNEFAGDGMALHGADAIDVVFGGWVGTTDSAKADWYLDGDSVRVVNAHEDLSRSWKTGKDVNLEINPEVTLADVTNDKLLAFDVKFEGTGDANVTMSFYEGSWNKEALTDIGVYQTSSGYLVANYHDTSIVMGTAEKGEGDIVTVYVENTQFRTDKGATKIGWGYLWNSSNGSIDVKSFRVVDKPAQTVGTFCKANETISLYLTTPVTKEQLAGKNVEFDFKFVTDGEVTLKMYDAQGDWKNMSGAFTLKKASGVVTTTKGSIKESSVAGYSTVVIPFADFNGSKLAQASGFTLLYSDGNKPTADMYIDWTGVRVVTPRNLVTGKDQNLTIPALATNTLVNDYQLAFDVVFEDDSDANIQVSLFKGSWGPTVVGDIGVYQTSSGIVVGNYHDLSIVMGVATPKAEDGSVTVYIDSSFVKTSIDEINWGYLWNSSKASIDLASFRAEINPSRRDWKTGNDVNLSIANIAFANVTEGKGFAFDVKFDDDTDGAYVDISFYEASWSKMAIPDIVVKQQADGSITATHRTEKYVYGTVTEKRSDGVVTVYVPADKFCSKEGAAAAGWGYLWTSSKASVDVKSCRIETIPTKRTWKTGNDVNLSIDPIVSYASVTAGKVLAFDVKFDDNTAGAYVDVSFYEASWSKAAIPDIVVKQQADGSVTAAHRSGTYSYGTVSAKDADGIVTVYVPADKFNSTEGATAVGWGYLWTSSKASIDIQSLRVVDAPVA